VTIGPLVHITLPLFTVRTPEPAPESADRVAGSAQ